jgi:hypothetical protein
MTALLVVPTFQGIDPAELDRVEAQSRIVEPRDGSRIFAEGDLADALFAIIGPYKGASRSALPCCARPCPAPASR